MLSTFFLSFLYYVYDYHNNNKKSTSNDNCDTIYVYYIFAGFDDLNHSDCLQTIICDLNFGLLIFDYLLCQKYVKQNIVKAHLYYV